jgi:hypothetical protein
MAGVNLADPSPMEASWGYDTWKPTTGTVVKWEKPTRQVSLYFLTCIICLSGLSSEV